MLRPFQPPTPPVRPDTTGMNVSDAYLALEKYADESDAYQQQLLSLLEQAANSATYHHDRSVYPSLP